MIQIVSEFTLLDKENQIAELTYSINGKAHAIIRFDFINNSTTITGDLYNLIGWKETEEDRNKYNQYIKIQQYYAKTVLDKY